MGCVLHVIFGLCASCKGILEIFIYAYIYCGWAIGAAISSVEVLSFLCERDFTRVKERERGEAISSSFCHPCDATSSL